MTIADPARAEHYLRFIGYYRLSGYWFPFQHRNGGDDHDNFQPGTDFETVLDRYVFDRRLRVLIMDASERIEVAARTAISNTLSERAGPHWYLDLAQFDPVFTPGRSPSNSPRWPSQARWCAPYSPRSAAFERLRHAHDSDPRPNRTKAAGQVRSLR